MLLERVRHDVNDELDFVNIRCGVIRARIGYRIAFAVDHRLRIAAKQSARFHRVPASFWRFVELPDLEDCPRPSRIPQQSRLTPTVSRWDVFTVPGEPLVHIEFDGMAMELDYEAAVKLGHDIRRAGRRAKAWAGDRSKYSAMLGLLTDAEDDYRLGIA
jgi:hypothetical protein